jgi:DNA-directed RNA polymerase subunit H (RpoH/RPB5)
MASVIPVMLDKLAEMLEDRNDFSADTLKNIKTDDFYGYDPVIVYSPKTCVIIALNQESKKNVIAKLKPDKKTSKTAEELDVFKEFVLEHRKYTNYIIVFEELTTADNKLLVTFDKILNKIDGLLSVFMFSDLHFNPTKHHLVDKHTKLTKDEIKDLMALYNIKSKTQLPIILKSDPIARWLGIRPGDIVKIDRYNPNSGLTYYYRACV